MFKKGHVKLLIYIYITEIYIIFVLYLYILEVILIIYSISQMGSANVFNKVK